VTEVLYDDAAHPGVALVTFDGEAKLNAFDRGTWQAFDGAIERIDRDAAIHVAVLTGRGRAFVAGADIGEYVDATHESFVDFQRLVQQVTGRLVACPKPFVAAVNGYALGGGFELVLACDLVVASRAARFGLPEARLGLLPGGGGTQRLPRAIGRTRAKELLMTARVLDAREADAFGLVNRMVEPEALLDAAFALADEIRALAPIAVRTAKGLVDDGFALPLSEALELEADRMQPLFGTKDAREGIHAFRAKREPRFTGE
jgi:enoyl-CoA hydratase